MRAQHLIFATLFLLFLCHPGNLLALASPASDTVEASISTDLHAKPGELIEVPVKLLSTGKLNKINGFYFVLSFDPKVLCLDPQNSECVKAVHQGTLAEPLGKPEVNMVALDQVAVGAASRTDTIKRNLDQLPLTILQFRVVGKPGDTTCLRFVTFELSSGGNATLGVTHDGCFRVDANEKLVIDSKLAIPNAVNQRLQVRLENQLAICGIQFTAKFDSRLLKINDVGVVSRTSGWQVVRRIFTDSLNVLLFHIPNDSLTAGTAPILEINFDVRGNARFGDTTRVKLANVLASDCNGKRVDLAAEDGDIIFGIKGDLNADGKIDQADLDILVAIIVDPAQQTLFTQWAGDLDNNNVLDIRDVILLNDLVNRKGSIPLFASAWNKTAASLLLQWGRWRLQEQEAVLPLVAAIAGEVKGLQFTLRGEAVKLLGAAVLAFNDNALRVASGRHGDEMIVLIYGAGDAVLPQGEMELFQFASAEPQPALPEIANQIAVTASAQLLATKVLSASTDTPASFRLLPNYPNPFRESTTFQLELAQAGEVRLEIFDLLGRSITTLVRRNLEPGLQQVRWDGKDSRGKRVPAGVYYFEVRFNNKNKMRGSLLILP